ncbi:PucR family transcriptional regulator [Bacillus sp. Bva_UNVM-123]|uniref:PucR family transcriptional regulator n=1 Tax=Bacillus sp. Bva_UNVM-123 TaxID=2829798 RepID=UPI00391F9262
MQTTVEEILALKGFEDVKNVAGEKGLSRVVNNVYFMEVPDIFEYVDPDGLLITTLYPIADDQEAIEKFIPELVNKGISGIAVKPGRFIEQIPEIMLEQANEYDFPIFTLPISANLSELSNKILDLLLGKKNSTLQFRDELHNKLMALLLEGTSLDHLVQSLASMIRAQVVLIDRHLDVLGSSFKNKEKIKIQKATRKPHALYTVGNQLKININGQEFDRSHLFVNPITVGGECMGYLIALSEDRDFDSNTIIAIEQASILIAIDFQRERAIQEKERNYLDSFIRDVLNRKFQSQFDVIQKAKIFKWDLDFPMVLLNIKMLEQEDEQKRNVYTELMDSHNIGNLIAEKLDISPRKCKVVYYDDALICFMSVVFEASREERLDRVCSYLLRYFKNKYKIGIGISDMITSVQQLSKAVEQTQLTTQISALISKGSPFVKRYHEIGVYKLLYQIRDENILSEYVQEKLGKVIENSSKDMDLLETLATLISNNLNIQKTAKDLFLHYNTLRYRVEKLKELGINLNNGFELGELTIAYQIYLMQHRKD